MTVLWRIILLASLAFPATWCRPAVAQPAGDQVPSLEQIHDSRFLSEAPFLMGRWADEGANVMYAVLDEETGATSLVRYNLADDSETVLVPGDALVATDTREQIQIEGFSLSDDGSKVLILADTERLWRDNTLGYYYLYEIDTGLLRPLSRRSAGLQQFAKFSPDGRHVGFVRNRNLFVVDLFTGRERQLTYDGSSGRIINGTYDWVYEEQFGLSDGWAWSPDGSRIAFVKLDETETREFALVDLRSQYPSFERYRYPKAGEANSRIKIGVAGVDTGTIRYIDSDTWSADKSDSTGYIAQMGWTPDDGTGARLWFIHMNRAQNNIDLMIAHPDSLLPRTILSESDDTWVTTGDNKITFLDDGDHFVWLSDRSGYNHLYLYRTDGHLETAITSGRWEVTEFHGVDEQSGSAYFTATIDSPIERHLYRIDVSVDAPETAIGPSPERVTMDRGTHRVGFSPDMRYFIDSHASAIAPTVVSLHSTGGERVKTLEANETLRERLATFELPAPEFTTVTGADGDALDAYLIRPTDFDPGRAYPLVLYVYGGPGSQTVVDDWGGSRYLWHAYLAEQLDVVVASVDGRGTGGRGKAFESQTHLQLGVLESADQIAAARSLGARDYIDADRIAIWGWSYGGYVTLMSMLTGDGPETFKAGIAVAPVTDWRLYDSIYTERYMSTPSKNPGGYDVAAPLTYADRLAADQRLLLVHGDLDDNVHFQQSVQMVEKLQRAGKQFDMMMYPGRDHSIYGEGARLHLFTMITEYLREHL